MHILCYILTWCIAVLVAHRNHVHICDSEYIVCILAYCETVLQATGGVGMRGRSPTAVSFFKLLFCATGDATKEHL